MRTPAFMKTIQFRLTLWYSLFLILLLCSLMMGINLVMRHYGALTPGFTPQTTTEIQTWIEAHQGEIGQIIEDLRHYSMIGALIVIVLGTVGGYFLSGMMLRPVDRVSSLAERISYKNLRERLNYKGPNDEIKRLADTFDSMLARLDSAAESQKQFIQDASHELRTPIAIAFTNIEVLEMNNKATKKDYQKLLDILKPSLERMNNINNNLLILSEGTSSKSGWSKVEMVSLITEMVNEVKTSASVANINIEWTPPTSEIAVYGDDMHMKQALFNLIDNAIKYNRSGGSIRLSAHTEDKTAVFEVADTGIGIAAEDLPRIFNRFFRVDKSRSRERGGSGLGLAIVKKIVEEHDGTISADSTLGHGSTIRISLPRYQSI